VRPYTSMLTKTSLFSGLSDKETDAVASCLSMRAQHYEKEEFVLSAGDQTEAIGLLLSGSLIVIQEDYWGNRNLITMIEPGQMFAEAFACAPGSVLNISVETKEASEILWLNVSRVLSTCSKACFYHNRLIRNLMNDLAGKNLRLGEKVQFMGQRSTREKLLSYLSSEADKQGSADFTIPFDRQQLADYLSVDRSAMSSELGKLWDEGKLSFDRSHFHLNP
jgi:CRP-like cAMP-binding protein